MNNTVAIVGRPNVGKSTLFNRLVGERKAIVDDISGVTRDRIYGISDWGGKTFNVIDTGGFVSHSDDVFEKEIRKQVLLAIQEATVVLFMMDVTCGITDLEQDIANMLRRDSKKVIVVVNKVDNNARMLAANEFYSLGFEHTFFIASISGSGTGELLEEVIKHIDSIDTLPTEGLPRFAIIGQPNVGKSSLVNLLIGEERNIVTAEAGTTRDALHTHYKLFRKEFVLIDTAGLRKKKNVDEDLEFYSVIRSVKAMDEADVCILLVEAQKGIEQQDLNIIALVERKRKGLVIAMNKWDLIEKETNTLKKQEEEVKRKIVPFTDVPLVFTSVKEKQRVFKVIETALEVYENMKRKVDETELNEKMTRAMEKFPHPSIRGQFLRLYKAEQVNAHAPTFLFHVNYPNDVKPSYKRYLENQMREFWKFTGAPVSILFRNK